MPETVVNEFMLYRQEYLENTGREIENEVLVYHVRQAFKPEEITPEEANEIGKELASRMTNDQFAYVVATHIDKHHVHNHIVICATALDCQHKYRDVKRSGKDLAQLSDAICEEHRSISFRLFVIRRTKLFPMTSGKAISGVSPIGTSCE